MAGDSSTSGHGTAPELALDRRAFVVSGAFALTALAGAPWLVASAGAAPANVDQFLALSAFLTGAPGLDAELAARAFGQLTELDAGFPDRAGALADAVGTSQAPTIDDFLAHPASSDLGLRETAVTIVSAWYLGYTGTPIALRAEDDTAFVTFTKALMYEPTIDATVRPSYARAGLDYWVDPPPFVTPPPMPAGIRSWGRESPQGVGAIPEAPAAVPDQATAPAAPDGETGRSQPATTEP
ncbi:MAG TPA: sugar dehydrogenase complex small subunit [Bauldia sp.]|nr:sugar dehydrogenase complex small subunit [Bauldia sp.]